MDNSNYPKKRHSEHLGVNKIGKNIRKNPVPQSNFDSSVARPVSQPQVYNVNKNDFRNIVQQLTGSPSHHSQEPLPRPPPKSPSMRLQRIRPPSLSPINVNRPPMPVQTHGPTEGVWVPLNDNNPVRHDQFGQPPLLAMMPAPHAGWSNTAESPISAYMRYLQHSINDPGNPQNQSAGLLPNPHGPPLFPSPRTSGQPPLLPSPNSQFLLPSPSGYLNLSSPRSPYPLLSPGYQHPPPLTPNFPFSPGILGPRPQPPRSPGISFPLSPGFFPVLSPRWRD